MDLKINKKEAEHLKNILNMVLSSWGGESQLSRQILQKIERAEKANATK